MENRLVNTDYVMALRIPSCHFKKYSRRKISLFKRIQILCYLKSMKNPSRQNTEPELNCYLLAGGGGSLRHGEEDSEPAHD